MGFAGGVGDLLARTFLRDTYFYLSSVKKIVDVLLFSPNPYVCELFKYHPNRANLRLHMFDMYPDFKKEMFFSAKGVTAEKDQCKQRFLKKIFGPGYHIRVAQTLPPSTSLSFYPSLKERLFFPFLKRNKYAVIQPFASADSKDLPKEILEEIVRFSISREIQLFFIVRKNIRTALGQNAFDPQSYLKKQLCGVSEGRLKMEFVQLSIPGVVELVRDAAFFAGGDSAFIKAAWYYRRPSLLFLPRFMLQREGNAKQFNNRSGIYFGLNFETSRYSFFEEFNPQDMRCFLEAQLS